MRKHLKLLGMSILTLTALLAVDAGTAQAKWLLLKEKTSVGSLELYISLNLSELLVPELGLEIHCNNGEGAVVMQTFDSDTTLLEGVDITFSGCFDLTYKGVCEVQSPGLEPGEILYQGAGEVSDDKSGKVSMEFETSESTEIIFSGEECPFAEIGGEITGTMVFEILNPLGDVGTHQIHLVDQELFFANFPAELHNGNGGILSGALKEATNKTWAIHLVNL